MIAGFKTVQKTVCVLEGLKIRSIQHRAPVNQVEAFLAMHLIHSF
jgi:hypothetical protein